MTAQQQAAQRRPQALFYLAVGVVCGAVMALQILQSRIFSVVTWYHLSFLTISIAMFGLTLGALDVYRGNKEAQTKNLGRLLAQASLWFGGLSVLTLFVQMYVPIVDSSFKSIIFTLPLVAGVAASAYYQAGKIVSLCLTRSGFPVGRVYGADMIGAALGCLFALGLMQTIDAPSAVLVVAGLVIVNALLFHRDATAGWQTKTAVLAVLIIAVGIGNAAMPDRPIYPRWTKTMKLDRDLINYEEWNAISRITVSPALEDYPVYVAGRSPLLPEGRKADYQFLRVDGAAHTAIIKFDGKTWEDVDFIEYDLTNLVHFVPGLESVGIVGVGGGRDLLAALYFGAKRVLAVDVNNVQIKLLTQVPEYKNYTNLSEQPGVRIVNSEARSWFTQNTETYDLLQMSLIDTWVSAAAGAFSLTENSLYTVEAWETFLNRVNDGGIFTVNRFHDPGASCNDLCRLATITATALLDRGQKEPWKHVFIAHVSNILTLIVGKDPLTEAQLDALHTQAERLQYTLVASPRQASQYETLNNILHASSKEDITTAIKDLPFDVSPSTDAKPFFFNQARIWRPWDVIRQATSGNMIYQNLQGHAVATVNLYIILLFSIVASVLVLVLPFRKALSSAPKSFIRAGTVYFALIGLGFMFIEITLMQMMSMFLGHPVYGLGVVLFSMILSTGVGSFASEGLLLNNRKRLISWSLLLAGYLVLVAVSVMPLMRAFMETDFIWRLSFCLLMIFPAGFMMGFAFPTGMRLTEQVSDSLTPWFWGINGALGVVASALAMVISIGAGLPMTILAGAVCYGLLAWPALILFRQNQRAV
jgi:predicted membrane-bound spermidine synthase